MPVGSGCDHRLVLLAYLDESYTDNGHYYIGALIVDGASAKTLSMALDQIVEKAAEAYAGLDSRAELHAHELVSGKRSWAPLRPMLRARIGLYHDAIQAIAESGARMIIRGVDVARLKRRYPNPDHPHDLVMARLIERVNDHAKAEHSHALLIADEVDERDRYRRDLWFYQRNGTWGYRARPIDCVIDTLYFAPSETSRLLQAADLAVYLYRRRHDHIETDERAEKAWAALYRKLEPTIAHAWCWRP